MAHSLARSTLCAALIVSLVNWAVADTVDLAYDPTNGLVQLNTNGLEMVAFNLQNAEGGDDFNTANTDFSDLPPGATDNIPTAVGWFSLVGFNGTVTLGNIFPTDFASPAELDGFLTNRAYGLQPPGGGGDLNIVFVEDPSPLGLADINELLVEVRNGNHDPDFDYNSDSLVDVADIVALVTDADKLNSYIGDANVDGEFSSTDLVTVFRGGQYEDDIPLNSMWETGDWNGDGEFDTGDLVFAFRGGGYEAGPRTAVAATVPEPCGYLAIIMTILLVGPAFRLR